MTVLIVEPHQTRGHLWGCCFERNGISAAVVSTHKQAIAHLRDHFVNVIVLNLMLGRGSSFAISDYASYRHPEAKVLFVTDTAYFSDGSIFQHAPNACALVPRGIPPEDLAAMVQHYGQKRENQPALRAARPCGVS